MKKIIIFGFLYLLGVTVFAQKNPQAWKKEKSLESQYRILKNNTNRWNGFVMLKEPQLNEFHKSIVDTVKGLEKIIVTANVANLNSKKEIDILSKQLSETQASLDTSLTKQDQLITLGMPFNKNAFPTIAYSIILLAIVVTILAFFLLFRSKAITKKTEKHNQSLSEELHAQKAKSLERETKLARELQTERNKNYS